MDTINEIVKSLEENSLELFINVSQILINIMNSILSDPNNLTFRSLYLTSDIFNELLVASGAMECLFQIGFQEDGDKLILPKDQSLDLIKVLNKVLTERRNKALQKQMHNFVSKDIHNPLIRKIKIYFNEAQKYRNESLLEEARHVIPLKELKLNAFKRIELLKESSKDQELSDIHFNDCLLYELLVWFKQKFFTWVNCPECDFCKNETEFKDMSKTPNGLRVEKFTCKICNEITNFIRYEDPGILLKTRRGRCGEWASAFTLLCCALGFDARHVIDETDHVWTEIYSGSKNRWIHCDPCETALDTPLMYEVGWKKQLTYVFAYSPYEMQDVTWRYSKDHKATLRRRNRCNETLLALTIAQLNEQRQKDLSKERREYLEKRMVEELVQLMEENKITEGDEKERQSGSLMWRIQRGEASLAPSNANIHYVWKPVENKKWLSVRYSCINDCYEQISDNGTISKVKGWQNGVYKTNGIFRKDEHDWKVVYLARMENYSEGTIVWNFNTGDKKLVINTVDVKFHCTTFENGEVKLLIHSGDTHVNIDSETATSFSTNKFDGYHEVYLSVKLSGGQGTVAWQHAQLFRQSLSASSDNYPFQITIKFKLKD